MARLIQLEANKTYATEANAVAAVEKKFPNKQSGDTLLYFLQRTNEGRFFPVFIGQSAIEQQVHFHFNVVG